MDLGDAKLILRVDDGPFNTKMTQIGNRTDALGKKFKKMGLAMVAAGAVIVGALGLALKAAADFESGMRKVNSMMGLSREEFSEFSDQVLQLSRDLGVNAVEATEALYQAISAGVPKENVIDFLSIASKAAIAGITNTETAVDGLTTVINAFRLPMSRAKDVADVMFQAVKSGKTTMEELSRSIGMVAPAAAAMGVAFEDVFAALATMTKQGINTDRATTALNAVMTALIKPTTEMSRALDELGYSSAEALIREVGLAGALTLLTGVAGGSKEMLGELFGSTEALKAIFALTGESASLFTADLAAMQDATEGAGAATDAFNEVNESATRQFERLKESMNAAMITLGEQLLPIAVEFAEKVSDVISQITDWITENENLAKTLLIIAGFLVAGGALLLGLSLVSKAIIAINSALVIMHSLSGPTGWAILAAGIGIAAASFSAIRALTATLPEPVTLTPEAHAAIQKGLEEGTITPDMLPASYKAGLYAPLPEMQYGGIVPGPIGAPIPIIAHGGEQFAGVGKSISPINIYIGSFMGDDASLRAFGKTLKEVIGQDGRRTSFPSINRLEYFPGSSAP